MEENTVLMGSLLAAFSTIIVAYILTLWSNNKINKTVVETAKSLSKGHCKEIDVAAVKTLLALQDVGRLIEKDGSETRETIKEMHKSIKSELKPSPP